MLTDVADVMPLLKRNYENNLSPAALRACGYESHLCSCGRVEVVELDWTVPTHYEVNTNGEGGNEGWGRSRVLQSGVLA
jgi:hypothetical protein